MEGKWGRFPSNDALISRGVNNISLNYGHCLHNFECADHIFIRFDFVTAMWEMIMRWCKINLGLINNIEDLLEFASIWGHFPKKRIIFIIICYGMVLCLWKVRNDRIFKQAKLRPTTVADEIQTLVFYWLKHRGSSFNLRSCNSGMSPFMCLLFPETQFCILCTFFF